MIIDINLAVYKSWWVILLSLWTLWTLWTLWMLWKWRTKCDVRVTYVTYVTYKSINFQHITVPGHRIMNFYLFIHSNVISDVYSIKILHYFKKKNIFKYWFFSVTYSMWRKANFPKATSKLSKKYFHYKFSRNNDWNERMLAWYI